MTQDTNSIEHKQLHFSSICQSIYELRLKDLTLITLDLEKLHVIVVQNLKVRELTLNIQSRYTQMANLSVNYYYTFFKKYPSVVLE